MSWKTLNNNNNNGGPLKHVASSAMLNATKTECKKRLIEILLSNNLNLLVIICQSPLVTEAGSTLPKSILKLLMAYQSEDIEKFIIRLLSYKARMYHVKNRDSCDILRDNSFLSTILNAYAHEIGYRYLTTTLSPTIKEILHYSKDLELDPHRIKKKLISEQAMNGQQMMRSAPVQETSSSCSQSEPLSSGIPVGHHDCFDIENEEDIDLKTRRIINNNIAKIENICLTLLNTIINNKEKMPSTLHHLCYSIANVIEYSYNQEVQKSDVNIAEMDYVSRQNSDLSMFNILNYGDDCKTPNGDFSTTPISITPFSTTPVSATNFLTDDKDFDRSRSNSFSLDTQNIYNQSIYSANVSDRDKSNGSLNNNNNSNNINYPLSASSGRNFDKHKKYESYTAGLVYNIGFNNLKNCTSISNSSNINDSEDESVNSSNKYLNVKYTYNNNRAYKDIMKQSNHSSNNNSLERLDNTRMELKSDDGNSVAMERRNSLNKDKHLKQQRRYNIFNNDFYSKSFKIQNQNSECKNNTNNTNTNTNLGNGNLVNSMNNILSNSDDDLLCSSPTCNSLNIEDDEDNNIKFDEIKTYSKGINYNMNKDNSDNFNEIYEEEDVCKDDGCNSFYEHYERNSYTIEEEEEEENIREEKDSSIRNSNSEGEHKNNEEHHNKKEKKDNENEITKVETIEISDRDEGVKDIQNNSDSKCVNDEHGETSKKKGILNVDDMEYDLYNEETINYFVTNYNNDQFLEQFMKKESYKIKEIISGTYINFNNNNIKIKEISEEGKCNSYNCVVNELERGQAVRLSILQRELLSGEDDDNENKDTNKKEDKLDDDDSEKDKKDFNNGDDKDSNDEDKDNEEKEEKDDKESINKNDDDDQEQDNMDSISNISDSITRIALKHGSSISDSLNGSKSDLEGNNRNSDRPNYRRNNSEYFKNYDSVESSNNDISDDDIRMSMSLKHAKQASQSSLLSRKNELGLKIETNNIKKPKKNIVNRLSDNIDPYSERKNKSKKYDNKEFASATVKGNPKIVEPRGPISSRDAEEETEERYFISLNDLECKNDYRKSKLEKQGSGFFLTKIIEYTNSEKVVGTFLFLRFFVPAITSPENFGLTHTKISINERKSLIICGKVLTALCNNVNFGGKEKYMEYLNPFLQVHREEAREFLQWAMSFDEDQQINSAASTEVKELLSSKCKSYEIEFDNYTGKNKYDSEYSSENSSYTSLTVQEPNTPSPGYGCDDKSKGKTEFLFSPKKKNFKNRFSRDESHFSSMPILNIDTNSSLDQLPIKERSPLNKESYCNSKNSIYTNHKQNLKLGSVRVKHVPLNDIDSTRSSIKNINTNEIKKDYDVEVKDIISFLTKNIHLLEKEIESKTNLIPPEESEGVYSGFLELKQLIFISEDNNSMKSWFKKIFRSKYSNSLESLTMQKSSSKSRRSSNNSILLN